MIYLDNAATGNYRDNVEPFIMLEMINAMKESWQNPSSLYASDVKNKIEECRKNVSNFIGAKPEEIYFTSGASESSNWAIRGWVDDVLVHSFREPIVIASPTEHKSILNLLENNNIVYSGTVLYCKVDKFGLIEYDSLENLLALYSARKNPILVSISMANNEIGVIHNINKISDLVHKYNGILHTDATQALPYLPIDVDKMGIDMLSASGHKISPVLKGIGFLYKRNGINIQPLVYGEQEKGLRGGTYNTFGIIGLSKALDYCEISLEKGEEIIAKRDYFIDLLKTKFGCKLNGHNEYRLPNNINVTFPQNITGESLLWTLNLEDVICSVGSACNSSLIEKSHVLKAIGLTDEEAMRSVRFTLHDDITYEDIDKVIKEIDNSIKLLTLDKEV